VGVLISDEVNYRRQHSFIIKTTQKYKKNQLDMAIVEVFLCTTVYTIYYHSILQLKSTVSYS